MKEIIFDVSEDPEGGLVAVGLGVDIVTQAESWEALREAVRDAVRCHFDQSDMPRVLRLHMVREDVIAA